MRGLAWALMLFTGAAASGPRVAVIIDDLGNRGAADRRAVALPGPVALSVLPHTPFARRVAEDGHAAGKEVLVHLPMQGMADTSPGPGVLHLHSTRAELERALEMALAAVPHARGINNHEGSMLTRHPGHMAWLMEAVARRGGLFFVDSRTTRHTVAERLAREHRVPVLSRDVFLDDDPSPESVAAQFERLLSIARRKGVAVAIGHPHGATLELLERRLPTLALQGIELVSLATLLEQEQSPWPAYSSP